MTKATRTSQRKVDANRRNAARSTGPRTAQGKTWSRLNALKHGILASQTVIAAVEGRAERKLFEQTVEALAQDFQPVGTYEQLLVQEIAACFWRKRRLLMFENRAAFDVFEIPAAEVVNNPPDGPPRWKEPLYSAGGNLTTAELIYKDAGLDNITLPNERDTMRVIRYEAAINRTRERAVRSLREIQKARGNRAAHPMAPVIDRVAARRNANATQAKMLSPSFSAQVWNKVADVYDEAATAAEAQFEEWKRTAQSETGETKPKTLADMLTPDVVAGILAHEIDPDQWREEQKKLLAKGSGAA